MLPATPYLFFPLAFAFFAAHVLALRLDLYWYFPLFDIPMHTMGGFLTVLGARMLGNLGSRRLSVPWWQTAMLLVVVMVAWEVFEFYFGIAGNDQNYTLDTIIDFICGAVGGYVGYVLIRKTM